MAYKKDKVMHDIKRLIQDLNKKGIKVQKAYLFGSYANGKPTKYSDVDVAIVSNQLEGNLVLDYEKLLKLKVIQIDSIEIHPYKPDEFTKWDPFVKEILKTGIRIL